ncbi:hypothetical protein BC829DRAFT_379838 [Chytridium lagenaria]|nr:hypothetical protein BC829DRAFT_379838 [Chytridium lagenaria]
MLQDRTNIAQRIEGDMQSQVNQPFSSSQNPSGGGKLRNGFKSSGLDACLGNESKNGEFDKREFTTFKQQASTQASRHLRGTTPVGFLQITPGPPAVPQTLSCKTSSKPSIRSSYVTYTRKSQSIAVRPSFTNNSTDRNIPKATRSKATQFPPPFSIKRIDSVPITNKVKDGGDEAGNGGKSKQPGASVSKTSRRAGVQMISPSHKARRVGLINHAAKMENKFEKVFKVDRSVGTEKIITRSVSKRMEKEGDSHESGALSTRSRSSSPKGQLTEQMPSLASLERLANSPGGKAERGRFLFLHFTSILFKRI